jgi:hypothetical protein
MQKEVKMLSVSEKFKTAIKTSQYKSYEIAHQAKLHPTMVSKLVHGIELIKENDYRVLALARVLGLSPDECFIEETR